MTIVCVVAESILLHFSFYWHWMCLNWMKVSITLYRRLGASIRGIEFRGCCVPVPSILETQSFWKTSFINKQAHNDSESSHQITKHPFNPSNKIVINMTLPTCNINCSYILLSHSFRVWSMHDMLRRPHSGGRTWAGHMLWTLNKFWCVISL